MGESEKVLSLVDIISKNVSPFTYAQNVQKNLFSAITFLFVIIHLCVSWIFTLFFNNQAYIEPLTLHLFYLYSRLVGRLPINIFFKLSQLSTHLHNYTHQSFEVDVDYGIIIEFQIIF